MDKHTIQRLNDINRHFYAVTAAEFDRTRGQSWQGWEKIPPCLRFPLSVLDVGCGNGRFGVFLAQHGNITYHGMDNNAKLLDFARASLPDATFEQRDMVENPPDSGQYDLVALFGVIHHIPGFEERKRFMRTLTARVAPGGMLAFASWRFYEFERFRERIMAWDEELVGEVEKHDYLLDWRRGENALRYCHYVDDAEQQALIEATGLKEVVTYRADGFTNTLNCYSLLTKI
jgi:tRNA (uracil-5-)-methyltransferase TRM9